MATQSARNDDGFSRPMVNAIIKRHKSRLKHKRSTAQPHHERKSRTWSDACVRAVNKMAYRHKNTAKVVETVSEWDAVIQEQNQKLSNRLNLYRTWSKREYHILEKMNLHRFIKERRHQHGSAWAYAVDIQVSMRNTAEHNGRQQHARRTHWFQFLGNSRKRLIKQYTAFKDQLTDWRFTVLAMVRKAYDLNRMKSKIDKHTK